MCLRSFGKPLFKKDTFTEQELASFNFINRPTKKGFYDFIHLLDKLLSENINKSFFDATLLEDLKTQNSGKDIGTLLILENWIKQKIRFIDETPKNEMFKVFRYIRKERQKPSHAIDSNEWNKKYWNLQRKLITDAYTAIRTLRLMLANHPEAKAVEVPEWLYKGDICNY